MATSTSASAVMMSVKMLAILLVAMVTDVTGNCVTADGMNGTCIILTSCPRLVDMMRNLTVANRNFLKHSQCPGFVGNIPNMCCSTSDVGTSDDVPTSTPRSPMRHWSPRAPPIDDRANLHMINSRSCGVGEASRIAASGSADMFEFPWVVLLGYRDGRGGVRFLCGGTLINRLYVLTAAYCIRDSLTTVRLGEYDITKNLDCEEVYGGKLCAEPVQDIAVNVSFSHPGYLGFPMINDIALVRLSRPADLSDSVNTICLPVEEAELERNLFGTTMTIPGWGIETLNGSALSSVLLKQHLPIVPNDKCHSICTSKLRQVVTERQVCVGGFAGGCGVDSGGPLTAVASNRHVQWGVASTGVMRCASANVPAVYTRVGHFMRWILDNLEP